MKSHQLSTFDFSIVLITDYAQYCSRVHNKDFIVISNLEAKYISRELREAYMIKIINLLEFIIQDFKLVAGSRLTISQLHVSEAYHKRLSPMQTLQPTDHIKFQINRIYNI